MTALEITPSFKAKLEARFKVIIPPTVFEEILNPDFEDLSKIGHWTNHVPDTVSEAWPMLGLEARVATALTARDAAELALSSADFDEDEL